MPTVNKSSSSGKALSQSISIRQLTFEALKVIESATSYAKNDAMNRAKSNLNEIITKSLASSGSVSSSQLATVAHADSMIPAAKQNQQVIEKDSGIKDSQIGVNKDRYKTELCRKFMENSSCPYGKKCQFAHGYHELRPVSRHPRYRTELCREYFNHGLCTYGTRCNFIHQLPKEGDEEDKGRETPAPSEESFIGLTYAGSKMDPQANHERPYTPSNDSGFSLTGTSPCMDGIYSPIESTRLSERSESPSELVAIQEVMEDEGV